MSHSTRAAQELERLRQSIDWKVEDIKSGYDILLSRLETNNPDYARLNDAVEQAIARHTTMSQCMV